MNARDKAEDTLPVYDIRPNWILIASYWLGLLGCLGLSIWTMIHQPEQLQIWMTVFFALSGLFVLMRTQLTRFNHHASINFMIAMFALLTAWRIAVIGQYDTIVWLAAMTSMIKIAMLIDIAWVDLTLHQTSEHRSIKRLEWHILLMRMMLGFVFIPHFTEKLFTGPGTRDIDVLAFSQLGVPLPWMVVIIAGLCEFAAGLALSTGLLTRLTAICTCLYLFIATYLGQHFSKGFIWVSAGGGWEYPMLWIAMIACFALFGPGYFSVDQFLNQQYYLPRWLKMVMGLHDRGK